MKEEGSLIFPKGGVKGVMDSHCKGDGCREIMKCQALISLASLLQAFHSKPLNPHAAYI